MGDCTLLEPANVPAADAHGTPDAVLAQARGQASDAQLLREVREHEPSLLGPPVQTPLLRRHHAMVVFGPYARLRPAPANPVSRRPDNPDAWRRYRRTEDVPAVLQGPPAFIPDLCRLVRRTIHPEAPGAVRSVIDTDV